MWCSISCYTRPRKSTVYSICANIYYTKLTLGSVFLLPCTVVSPMKILDTIYAVQVPELCEVGCKLKIYVPKQALWNDSLKKSEWGVKPRCINMWIKFFCYLFDPYFIMLYMPFNWLRCVMIHTSIYDMIYTYHTSENDCGTILTEYFFSI